MAGPQFAGGASHGTQPLTSDGFAVRLAIAFAIKQKHGVAAENQRADGGAGKSRLTFDRIGDRLGDGRNGDIGKITGLHIVGILHDFRSQRNDIGRGSGLKTGDGRISRNLTGLQRISDDPLARSGGCGRRDVTVRLMYGLGLGGSQDHHSPLDRQIGDANPGFGGGAFQRSRLVDVRNADGRADAG